MGHTRHRAVIVSDNLDESIEAAHKAAKRIFEDQVSDIVPGHANGWRSFFIGPDGGEDGWHTSDHYDKDRAKFCDWLVSRTWCIFAEVQYGDDNGRNLIVRTDAARGCGA